VPITGGNRAHAGGKTLVLSVLDSAYFPEQHADISLSLCLSVSLHTRILENTTVYGSHRWGGFTTQIKNTATGAAERFASSPRAPQARCATTTTETGTPTKCRRVRESPRCSPCERRVSTGMVSLHFLSWCQCTIDLTSLFFYTCFQV